VDRRAGGARLRGAARPGREAPAIRAFAADDHAQVAALLARAFRDNPLNVAVVGAASPERRLRSNLLGTGALLHSARENGEVWVARVGGRPLGALVGTGAWEYPLPPAPLHERLRCLFGQGLRVVRRWGEVFAALDAIHPPGPHRYVGTLGVAPEHQRQGVGTALLRFWLARADAEGLGVYLETDRPENRAFYAREGFEVVREAVVVGVPVWCMQRPARDPGAGAPRR
jgi:ribosomal protein S18 acetylase RimI-like enzyme